MNRRIFLFLNLSLGTPPFSLLLLNRNRIQMQQQQMATAMTAALVSAYTPLGFVTSLVAVVCCLHSFNLARARATFGVIFIILISASPPLHILLIAQWLILMHTFQGASAQVEWPANIRACSFHLSRDAGSAADPAAQHMDVGALRIPAGCLHLCLRLGTHFLINHSNHTNRSLNMFP